MLGRLVRCWRRRPPDEVIGRADDPYMRRWFLVPKNRWFGVYLHNVLRSDKDRVLHDHPWDNVSIVLAGGYFEITERGRKWRRPGSIVFRRAQTPHRLELDVDYVHDRRRPCWTLFLVGPKVREWGFWTAEGWVHWRSYPGEA